MVELQAVTVRFGSRKALSQVSLAVPRGGSLALWGTNGAGKSTTFHAILGLVPFEGRILVGGLDVARDGARTRKLIGWAPQDLAPSDLVTERVVHFTADVREVRIPSAEEFLAQFGLQDAVGKTVSALSGGQRKRLSLALAQVGDPPVLLLDEPTANVDAEAREQLILELLRLRRQGKTLIMASHRVADVARLSDQVAVLADGTVSRVTGAGVFSRWRGSLQVVGRRKGAN